jgi:lipid II:glycine glycyltransferase (peptidoglycan interpeptide bridge formation enzyme)
MMTIDWSPRSIAEWRHMLKAAPRSNWMQSLTLAKALKDLFKKHSRIGAIRLNGKIIGMLTLQEVAIGPFKMVELYRGPIWFYESPEASWLEEFAKLFAKEYPKGLLQRRRWLPEWPDSETARKTLKKQGFKGTKNFYETIWLDLTQAEEDLRASLKKNWRADLKKGGSTNIDVRIDREGSSVDIFLEYNEQERARKKYRTRGPELLANELKNAAMLKELLILWAVDGKEPVAAVAIVMHGNSATYRAGWSLARGRELHAHNVLLWDAVTMLKSAQYRALDLGGTTPTSGSAGYIKFKQGMGGETFRTIGVSG